MSLVATLDPSEYKRVVLGLILLKYSSDAFEERREAIRDAVADPESDYSIEDASNRERELPSLLEDCNEYTAEDVFWVPDVADSRTSKRRPHSPQSQDHR